jgi:Domain of unknown function (DUF1876)
MAVADDGQMEGRRDGTPTGGPAMSTTKHWNVEVHIGEEDSETYARAQVRTEDGAELRGEGTARCNPADPNVPKIGDEIAVARALSDLSHQLLHKAAAELEEVVRQPVDLRG